eukprot:TRINITY_DN7660_c0_g1_i1.p1 TRINITY_DN7660_c0_g1~~TRINITY_DN7660_c0_g1_i1.p1  ORF type:complete len:247 (+),score=62.13 TRINITY_DN7660_c0_g1_i1:120-860(+)
MEEPVAAVTEAEHAERAAREGREEAMRGRLVEQLECVDELARLAEVGRMDGTPEDEFYNKEETARIYILWKEVESRMQLEDDCFQEPACADQMISLEKNTVLPAAEHSPKSTLPPINAAATSEEVAAEEEEADDEGDPTDQPVELDHIQLAPLASVFNRPTQRKKSQSRTAPPPQTEAGGASLPALGNDQVLNMRFKNRPVETSQKLPALPGPKKPASLDAGASRVGPQRSRVMQALKSVDDEGED